MKNAFTIMLVVGAMTSGCGVFATHKAVVATLMFLSWKVIWAGQR